MKKQLKNIAWYPILGMIFCAIAGLTDKSFYGIRGYDWLIGFWICFAVLYVIVTIREIQSDLPAYMANKKRKK